MKARWSALVWLLPIALALHAVLFWGARGFIDKEGVVFVSNYLADRPWLAMIFDPHTNDFTTYQARELSYAFDYLNARTLVWLYSLGWFVLIPLTGVAGLAAAMVVYARGASRWRGLDASTIALLLAWFLSAIVVQASVAIFYRSAKMLLLVFLLAFLFQACRLLRRDTPPTWRALTGLFAIALLMALADRQGFFFLVWFAGVAAVWYVLTPSGDRPAPRPIGMLAATLVAAGGAAEIYNRAVAPWLVQRLNGYWPDFSYQDLDIAAHIGTAGFWRAGLEMMARQVGFSTGGVSIALITIASLAAVAAVRSPSWRVAVRDVATGAAGCAGLVLLAALMILRHPYVATIPDHAYWYNFLPVHGVFLVAATAWLARLALTGAARAVVRAALVLIVVWNMSHYREHRHAMLASPYIAAEYEKTREMVDGVRRLAAGDAEPSGVSRWLSAGPAGGVVRLPSARAQFFPDTLDAILATRARRPPFDRPLGTHWLALRDFYVHDGSPLNDPDQIGATLDAWRAAGVREVRVDLSAFTDRAAGERLHAGIHARIDRVVSEAHRGAVTSFFLADLPAPPSAGARTRVPPAAIAVTASPQPDQAAALVDGDVNSRWSSGREQRGDEWIRVAFDRPRDVARLRLDLERRSYGDYPRGVRIESIAGDVTTVLFDGSALPAYALGLLEGPLRTAGAAFDVPPNRSSTIVIRQTGAARGWHWSVHELAVWER
jgi:hypothetical protein